MKGANEDRYLAYLVNSEPFLSVPAIPDILTVLLSGGVVLASGLPTTSPASFADSYPLRPGQPSLWWLSSHPDPQRKDFPLAPEDA